MESASCQQTTLAILAGGEGSRMGRPKGELRLGGKPILKHVLERMEWVGPTVVVTSPGRQRPSGVDGFGLEACDPVSGQGPLRGVLTALQKASTELVVVLAVDMPAITVLQGRWLVEAMKGRTAGDAILLQRVVGGKRLLEPFPSIYRRRMAPVIAQQLDLGQRSVHRLAQLPNVVVVSAPTDWPDQVWTNLNDPSNVAEFERGSG
jgi:molybdopterin-guanine dinucleotide biosynthesis protein A